MLLSPSFHTLQSELHGCPHGSHSTCWSGPAALSVKKLLPGTETKFLAWGTWPYLFPKRWEGMSRRVYNNFIIVGGYIITIIRRRVYNNLVGGYIITFKVCASDVIFSWPPGKTELLLSSLVEPGGRGVGRGVNTWEFKSLRGIHPNEPILSLRGLFFPSKATNLAKETCQVITFNVPCISGIFMVKSLVQIFSKVCDMAGEDKGLFKSTHWNSGLFGMSWIVGWFEPIILSSRFLNLFFKAKLFYNPYSFRYLILSRCQSHSTT